MAKLPWRIWFSRSFDLGLGLDVFPELLERLRGTPARLEERLTGLDPDVLRRRHDGDWSIQEHAGHLSDLEPLWIGRVADLVAGRSPLRSADLENRATWEADHNQREVETILADFRMQRTALIARLEGMGTEALTASSRHPRLDQAMTAVDLAFFVAEHDDHHLATITRLLSKAPNPDGQ